MKTIVNWTLGGALAASLAWNWTLLERSKPPPEPCAQSCAGADGCGLDLSDEQRAKLGELCDRTCGESDRLDRRADELQRELLASLARPEIDEEATRVLVAQLVDLRRRSLEACIAGIRAVRGVLTPEQVSLLVARCQDGECRGALAGPRSQTERPSAAPLDPRTPNR